MTSKKYVYSVLIVTLFLFLFFSLTTYFFYKTSQHMFWINNAFTKKELYSKTIEQPKVIFSAGSSTLFGVDTKTIEESLNTPVLNYGTHAGLRTDYILYRTKQIAKKGDTVIFPIEYHNILWDGAQSIVRRNYILTHDHTFFINEINLLDKVKMLMSIKPIDLAKSFKDELKGVKKAKIGENYNSDTLNKNGDETYKKGNYSKKIQQGKPFEFEEFYETKGLSKIKDFSKWAKENGVHFVLTFPSTLYFDIYDSEEYQKFFKELKSYFNKNDIKFIGEPNHFFYKEKYFYDSYYHLNDIGSTFHTKKLLDLLVNSNVIKKGNHE